MKNTMSNLILQLMSDGHARTSYEITDALFGAQPDGRRWFRVATWCDWLAAHGKLRHCGKVAHRSVYEVVIASTEIDA